MWDSNGDGFPELAGEWDGICRVPVAEMHPSVKDSPSPLFRPAGRLVFHPCLLFGVWGCSSTAVWFTDGPEGSSFRPVCAVCRARFSPCQGAYVKTDFWLEGCVCARQPWPVLQGIYSFMGPAENVIFLRRCFLMEFFLW